MRLIPILLAALALASPARAASEISIDDGFVRAAGAMALAGAAYFTIHNDGDEDDRLIGVHSDAAKRLMLHASVADGAVMRMVALEDGIAVPAGGTHRLETGGDHVMLMGLTDPLEQGETVTLTLVFEKAGEVNVDFPVDNRIGAEMEGMAQ